MIAKLELYAVIAMAVILAALAAGAYERHVGYREAQAEGAAAVLKANQQTEVLNGKLQHLSESHSQTLADLEAQHSRDLDDAVSRIKPVIVRIPAANQGAVPAIAGAANLTGASGQSHVSLPVERDISRSILVQAGYCQQDRDALDAMIAFYNDLRGRLTQ
jgi:hypothetical protein